MPGATPKGHDSYICMAFKVDEAIKAAGDDGSAIYVTKFEPVNAVAERAHHMILRSCENPPKKDATWDCRHHAVCNGAPRTLFAWAKNAEATSMPEGVGFKIDPEGEKVDKYFVLQVHYVNELDDEDHTGLKLTYQTEKTPFTAGIYLLVRSYLSIPADTPKIHGDVNCALNTPVPIHIFAYRTHAHKLGSVISGYKYSDETQQFTKIAKGNPQWPQAFYPVKNIITVKPGEYINARCTYNTTGFHKRTRIGATAGDEMCNLYLMYYMDETHEAKSMDCVNVARRDLFRRLPLDSDTPLPYNPLLEDHAKHSHPKDNEKTSRRKDLDQVVRPEDVETSEDNKGMRRKGDLDSPSHAHDEVHSGLETIELQMPGGEPDQDDDYICTAFPIKTYSGGSKMFVTGYFASASSDKAHHMILQKCEVPVKQPGEMWKCQHHAVCKSQASILYAWAKDAPPTTLPPDVAFEVDDTDGYFVLQVHYKHSLPEKDYTGLKLHFQKEQPTYLAGIYLMFRSYLHIPAHAPEVHGDMNCKVREQMTVFAFRTHTHTLGTEVTGYTVKDGDVKEIARGDPQKPQTFYPMEKHVQVLPGDFLMARCNFNSMTMDKATQIGSTAGDEMCNLYLMYYQKAASPDSPAGASASPGFKTCMDEEIRRMSDLIPTESTKINKEEPISYTNVDDGSNDVKFVPLKTKKQENGRKPKGMPGSNIYPVPNWPPKETADKLGQLSGCDIDVYGNLVIFHRGDRTWGYNTFKANNEYAGDMHKPIPVNTILTLDSNGKVINEWGKDMFYLPHMLTVDKQNNIWVTDVAMHQVFKFAPYGGNGAKKMPLIVLGTPFQPGSDKTHYCKPTSVAVESDGETFYVADGYCNSRIIKYRAKVSPDGYHNVTWLTSWGEGNGAGFSISRSPYAFNIPHSLALAEDKGLICVADRENGRIQCFSTDDGVFKKTIQPKELGSRVYGVDYTPANGGRLVAVCGPEPFGALSGKHTQGYVIDIDSGKVLSTFNGDGDGFQNPHDVAVSKDGETVYEVELKPFKVFKLTDGKTVGPTTSYPAVPSGGEKAKESSSETSNNLVDIGKQGMEKINKMIPKSGMGVTIAAISVCFTFLFTFCMMCRRCRKRGKGTMKSSNGSKKGDSKLDLGDFLGRSRDGFQPLKQEDDDDVGGVSEEDSDDLEEFSVPALRA